MLEKLLAKRHVKHLDLRPVQAKVIEKLGWSADQAESVEQEYRRFLYALTQKGRGEIISPPSKEVDEFWHQHILDTRKYRDDCQKLFGHYMDHIPALTSAQQAEADERRRRVYAEHRIDSSDFYPGDIGSSCGASSEGYESHHVHGHGGDGHSGSCEVGHGDGGGHGGGDACSDGGAGDGSGGGDGGGGCGAGCGGG